MEEELNALLDDLEQLGDRHLSGEALTLWKHMVEQIGESDAQGTLQDIATAADQFDSEEEIADQLREWGYIK